MMSKLPHLRSRRLANFIDLRALTPNDRTHDLVRHVQRLLDLRRAIPGLPAAATAACAWCEITQQKKRGVGGDEGMSLG